MKTSLVIASLSIGLWAGVASIAAQAPGPGQTAPPPVAQTGAAATSQRGTATLRGRITSADGKPLRRARLALALASPVGAAPALPSASTNAQGLFELRDVPAGTYRLTATRAGYLSLQYGQRRPQEAGRSIEVKDGQVVERLDFALPAGAVLAGVITDERGEPYPGVRVEALEHRYMNGRASHFPAGIGTTDDLGRFRIPGLAPGTFYLMASSKESLLGGKDGKETLSYGFSYYPGVPPDKAEVITLGVGEQRDGVGFRLEPNRTARVRGRAESPEGAPLDGRPISLTFEYRGSGAVANPPMATTRTGRDGTFELRDIPPGTYRVLGAGSVSVDVHGADIDGLVMVPRVGSTISGTVATDEGIAPPFAPTGLRVLLEQGSGEVLPTVRVQNINPDWTFRLTSVGGTFRFRFSGLREDWILKSVLLNGKDITDADWDVPTGDRQLDGLQLVMTRKIGTLSGDVVTATGKPTSDATIVVFADDATLWAPGTRHIRTIRPDDNGRFTIKGLAPAVYRVAAREYVQNGQWLNPPFLESLRESSTRFEISEGGSATVTLKLP